MSWHSESSSEEESEYRAGVVWRGSVRGERSDSRVSQDSGRIDSPRTVSIDKHTHPKLPERLPKKSVGHRRRSSVARRVSVARRTSIRNGTQQLHHGTWSGRLNGRRRPSRVIESIKKMEMSGKTLQTPPPPPPPPPPVEEEEEEEEGEDDRFDDEIRTTRGLSKSALDRIPGILRGRDGRSGSNESGVSSRSSIYDETVYTRRLVDAYEESEKQKRLESERVKKDIMKREAAASISELMLVNDRKHLNSSRLRTVIACFRHNRGFPITANPTRVVVTDVFLSGKYSLEGARDIADSIRENKAGLKRLEFRDCHFNEKAVCMLMDAIINNETVKSQLHTLRFDGNDIGLGGAKALGKWLEESDTAIELGLCDAGLTDVGATFIAEGLDMNETLETFEVLELAPSDHLSDEVLDDLMDVLDSFGAEIVVKKKNQGVSQNRKK